MTASPSGCVVATSANSDGGFTRQRRRGGMGEQSRRGSRWVVGHAHAESGELGRSSGREPSSGGYAQCLPRSFSSAGCRTFSVFIGGLNASFSRSAGREGCCKSSGSSCSSRFGFPVARDCTLGRRWYNDRARRRKRQIHQGMPEFERCDAAGYSEHVQRPRASARRGRESSCIYRLSVARVSATCSPLFSSKRLRRLGRLHRCGHRLGDAFPKVEGVVRYLNGGEGAVGR
mmetsp:Transcript_91588/g.143737  ORF Transcript_91588/g.143737 Transcript_91588/m.143737 type:complete len:231 (-) Transcript_91588:1423-2115(-)